MAENTQELTHTTQELARAAQELAREPTLIEALLLWAAVVICLAIVAGIQYRAFGTAGKTRVAGSLASFFHLHEIVEKWQRDVCAVVTAIPLSFVFFVIAVKPDTFRSPLSESLLKVATDGNEVIEVIVWVLVYAPPALFPFLILLISFLVLGAQIRFLFRNIEKGVVSVAGLAQRAEDLAQTVSAELLEQNSYEEIVDKLEVQQGKKLALAEELEDSTDLKRLSFQLLHLTKRDIPIKGPRAAFLDIVESDLHGVIPEAKLGELCSKVCTDHLINPAVPASTADRFPPRSARGSRFWLPAWQCGPRLAAGQIRHLTM